MSSTVTDERLRELADIAGRWAEERALSPESRPAYLDMQQALRELPKQLREAEVLNAERNRQNAAAFTENDRLRAALRGKHLTHELTDLMARLLHYQDRGEPDWAGASYETAVIIWCTLPADTLARYRNDAKFRAQVTRAVAYIRDKIGDTITGAIDNSPIGDLPSPPV